MKLTCPLCGKSVRVIPSQGNYSAYLAHHRGRKTNKQCGGSGMSEGATKWANERKDTPGS